MIMDALFGTASSMDNHGAVEKFIRELLTESEQLTIGRRILVAQMILSGKNQAEVSYELSISPNTFTRTRKWLHKQLPKYDEALKDSDKLQEVKREAKRKIYREKIDPLSFESMKRKYPAHFLLFNVADAVWNKFNR